MPNRDATDRRVVGVFVGSQWSGAPREWTVVPSSTAGSEGEGESSVVDDETSGPGDETVVESSASEETTTSVNGRSES